MNAAAGVRHQLHCRLAGRGPLDFADHLTEIQLRDNGPGLPKEAVRLVFDPFVVRGDSPMEYGIHLMACFFIVHHHGGLIDARTDEGNGTIFTLRLPTNPAQVPPTPNDHEFLTKLLLNQTLWENLIASD